MQRVAAVAAQVAQLRPTDDEHVQAGRADDGADRVHPRPAVSADGGEKSQGDVERVELFPAGPCEVRSLLLELSPSDHAA